MDRDIVFYTTHRMARGQRWYNAVLGNQTALEYRDECIRQGLSVEGAADNLALWMRGTADTDGCTLWSSFENVERANPQEDVAWYCIVNFSAMDAIAKIWQLAETGED